MTREQAQVYAKLSKEDIAKIAPQIDKHYETFLAFANGKEIECFDNATKIWLDCESPNFFEYCEYRVKPENAEQSSAPWKPKKGEEFFFLDSDMSIISTIFYGVPSYECLFSIGNCFRTRKEAEAARERVLSVLKGN